MTESIRREEPFGTIRSQILAVQKSITEARSELGMINQEQQKRLEERSEKEKDAQVDSMHRYQLGGDAFGVVSNLVISLASAYFLSGKNSKGEIAGIVRYTNSATQIANSITSAGKTYGQSKLTEADHKKSLITRQISANMDMQKDLSELLRQVREAFNTFLSILHQSYSTTSH